MSMKDDPMGQRPGYRTDSVTLWLDRDGMVEARDNYFAAFKDQIEPPLQGGGADRRTWDIAYAAAVAAFDFLMSGRIKPKP
jgi:hypothetical protein